MRMKHFKFAAFVLAMALVTPAFVACGSDDDETITIDVPQSSYSINRMGGTIVIDLKTNGSWTAEIPEKDGEKAWADVVNAQGTGNGKIEVTVDYFSPRLQQGERSTQLIVNCGDLKKVITLRQFIGLKEGETAPNDSEMFFDLWAGKGLGAGYNVETGEEATDKILNVTNLAEFGKDVQTDVMSQQRPTNTDLKDLQMDTLFNDTVGLSVNAKIDVNYLKFKLTLQVDYDNKDLQFVNAKTYNASQSLVFLSSRIDVATLQEIMMNEANISTRIFSRGFRGFHKRIRAAYAAKDQNKLNAEIDAMLNSYGPAFVAGADLGGNLLVSVKYDSTYIANKFNVKGSVSVDMTFGPLQIKGGVSVGYSRIGEDTYTNCQHHINVSGGDKAAIADFTALLSKRLPDPDAVTNAAQVWAKSIISSNDEKDNTRVLRVNPRAIWALFPTELQPVIKNRAVEYYKGKKTCIDVSKLR